MSGEENGSEGSLPGRAASRPRVAVTRLLPSRTDYAGISRTWRADVVAGVTVGVVALPLALAFSAGSKVAVRGRSVRRGCRGRWSVLGPIDGGRRRGWGHRW